MNKPTEPTEVEMLRMDLRGLAMMLKSLSTEDKGSVHRTLMMSYLRSVGAEDGPTGRRLISFTDEACTKFVNHWIQALERMAALPVAKFDDFGDSVKSPSESGRLVLNECSKKKPSDKKKQVPKLIKPVSPRRCAFKSRLLRAIGSILIFACGYLLGGFLVAAIRFFVFK